MHRLSNAVTAEASLKGLNVEKVISADRRFWDGRFLVVEDKPCQIVRTSYHISDPRYPEAVSIRLYLPRGDWPDFLIYVTQRPSLSPEFYIVPRGDLSKDTALCPTTLAKYRDAWSSLATSSSPDQIKRRFTVLNWQLQEIMAAARKAGMDFSLIRRLRKRWPIFIQTRIMIAGRRCTVHSFSRLQPDPSDPRHDHVALRKQKGEWAEFELYVLPQSNEPTVYVMPCGSIKSNTAVSLKNEKLVFYRNNWSLLTQPVGEINEIEWRTKAPTKPIVWRTKTPKPPKPTPAAIQAAVDSATRRGLAVERPHLESQYQILISGKRCQIVQTKPIMAISNGAVRAFVPLNLPRLDWAEFLIFFVRPDAESTCGDFYIVPRTKLPRRTVVSPVSSWLREHAGAWHLIQ